MTAIKSALALALVATSVPAFAAGGAVQFVDYYHMILHGIGIHDPAVMSQWIAVPGAVATLFLITLMGIRFKKHCESFANDPTPSARLGVMTLLEIAVDFVHDLARDIIGKDQFLKFLKILTGLFLFILVSNLSGLVPGFHPTTSNLNTNLAMGLCIFILYNWAGIREHGSHYIQQFLGPIVWMIPLMFVIELIAHLARPVSLSLRLYGNLFGDHLVLSVFTGLTYLGPALLLFFGLLVALIQSFVFTLLSSIYISMAISHDH